MYEYTVFIAALGSKGVDEVRSKLSRGDWANKRKKWAQDWLVEQDSKLEAQRGDTALAIAAADSASAREAIDVSREDNKIAHAASVAATAAASLASDAQ